VTPPSLTHIACSIAGARSGPAAVATARSLAGGVRLSLLLGRPYDIVPETVDGQTVFRHADPEASARQWRRLRDDLPEAEPVFLPGDEATAICAWAARERPDILVVGADAGFAPGRQAARFVGHLLERAPCPVLIVRGGR
jgi:nucleotide-binding universal stress UspA family protein